MATHSFPLALYVLLLLSTSPSPILASPTLPSPVNIAQRQNDPNPFPTLTGSGQESPNGPTVTVTPSPSATTGDSNGSGEGGGGGGGGLSLEIILPIVVLLATAVLLAIFFHYRVQIKAFLRKHFGLPSSSTTNGLPHTSTRDSSHSLTAEQLSGHTTPNRSVGNVTGSHDGNAASNAGARDRRRRRERNVRRTESGRSVRTLPVYSKEAGDEELVLVRQRSQSSFSYEAYFDQDVTDSLGDAERGLLASTRRPRSLSIRSSASRRRSGSQESHSDHDNGDTGDIPLSTVREGHEPSETLLSPLTSPAETAPHSAPLPRLSRSSSSSSGQDERPPRRLEQPQNTVHRSDSLGRRGWGEAPTYLEAMSSPFPPSSYPAQTRSPVAANVPPPRDLRTRTSSTFRGLLSKAGFTSAPSRYDHHQMSQSRTSSTSLLLQPTTSRLSSMSFRPTSPTTSPGASTLSLVISSPIPNTAVRASFDSTRLPRAGLSDDQMRFLGSQEALSVAGVKLNEVPENRKRRRRSEALSVDETLFGGRSRGDSVSSDAGGRTQVSGGVGTSALGGSETMRRGSESSADMESGQEYPQGQAQEHGQPPSWEQSENLRRQNQAFERRNLAKPINTYEEGGEAEQHEESQTVLNNPEFDAVAEAQKGEDSTVSKGGISSVSDAAIATTTPLPPSPVSTTRVISPTTSITTASASKSAPTLEIEPPTPIVGTPPPQGLSAR
ncbi:hypothetical protein IAU59_003738 [Kwoniella sp. CBS 9459]